MTGLPLLLMICLVALVYASVGHGGASGYLAVLAACTTIPSAQMSTTALILNVLVAGAAWQAFWRAGHGSLDLLWPFLLGSVPCALLGGSLRVSSRVYDGLLAFTLACAAVRLLLSAGSSSPPTAVRPPRRATALLIGGAIGAVSGIVGVGGGIFLSPLMILRRWADPKQAAAASACFIVLNSAAGLLGRGLVGLLDGRVALPFVGAAVAGGVLGSRLGAGRLSHPALRRILAGVLLIAIAKRVMPWWS